MRQIKFRGKSLKNKKWVYGDLMSNICGTRIVRYKETDNGAYKRADWEYIDVEPDSVGQFTGLTDCNGKEIYEGDIFTVNGKYPKLVEYREDRAAFCVANVDELDKEWLDPWQQPAPDWWYSFSREIIVVGNKFDNPSLIPTNRQRYDKE